MSAGLDTSPQRVVGAGQAIVGEALQRHYKLWKSEPTIHHLSNVARFRIRPCNLWAYDRIVNADTVRAGFDLLLESGPEALVEWLDPDVEMVGPSPSPWDCHGRDAVVRFLWEFQPGGTALEVTEASDAGDQVLLGLRRRYGPRQIRDSFSVVSFREGRVIKIQGYPTRAQAVAALKASRAVRR